METIRNLKPSARPSRALLDCRSDRIVLGSTSDSSSGNKPLRQNIWNRKEVPRQVAIVHPIRRPESRANPPIRETDQRALGDQGQIRTVELGDGTTTGHVLWSTLADQQSLSGSDSDSDSGSELELLWELFEVVAERYFSNNTGSSSSDSDSDSTSSSSSSDSTRTSSSSSSSSSNSDSDF
ncbi:uncharacterized protein LOC134468866 [Engraulis encrasicolus]|uniref:uncharacterized protein LOC134468866 n=1 Tax=Engraulis encrasicolus TaxID=184585 RepID=UPI002FD420BD